MPKVRIPPGMAEQMEIELDSLSRRAFTWEARRVTESQPSLFAFLAEICQNLPEDALLIAGNLGLLVCRCFEKATGAALPEVPPGTVESAFEEAVSLWEEAEQLSPHELEDRIFPRIAASQPALITFVGSCLFGTSEDEEDEEGLPPEAPGILFLALKTFIDALDRHVASADTNPRHGHETAAPAVYRIKVTLKRIRPPIWRRLLVPSDLTLARLHDVIQIAMGWRNVHLHEFTAGGRVIGEPGPGLGGPLGPPAPREETVTLGELLRKEKDKIGYEYDFGDSWEHEIRLEKILPPDPDLRHPVCLKGRRACPPEDCGGPWGYADLLEALADPEHPEHETLTEWLPAGWDPERFDLEEINEKLKEAFGG